MVQKSFLKWAGGKSQSIEFLKEHIGAVSGRFIEPFTGSGVVTLNVKASEYIIGDSNFDLINLYSVLKTKDSFIEDLKYYFSGEFNNSESFYKFRTIFNTTLSLEEKAMLFVYLNRHCFNGLCRYNKSGKFNVPFGKYKKINLPEKELLSFKTKLQECTILHSNFNDTIRLAKQNDVIYCVPENTLVYQDGFYLPISEVVVNKTDMGNGNICTNKYIRSTINEEIVSLNVMGISRHYDLKLSKNHRVFTYNKDNKKIIEKRAEDLTTDDLLLIDYDKKVDNFIPKYCVYNSNNKKILSIKHNNKNMIAKFIGLYMAEGHIQSGVYLSFGVKEYKLHTMTKDLIFECFGLDAQIRRKSPHKTVTQVVCCSKEFEKYILEFYNGKNAIDKKMKSFVMSWDLDMQLNLLVGWLLGDRGLWQDKSININRKFVRTGKRNKYKITGTSSSFELSTQMYNIALRCGLHPSFKKRVSKCKIALKTGEMETISYDVYFTMKEDIERLLNITIIGRQCGRRFHIEDHMVTKLNNITKEYYTGNMYDLTTTNGNFWCMGNVKIHNCDPPYVPLSTTSSFTDYNAGGFSEEQQKLLANMAEQSYCKVLISNHDTSFTRELYKNADEIKTKEVSRFISANGKRDKAKELLAIYNGKGK